MLLDGELEGLERPPFFELFMDEAGLEAGHGPVELLQIFIAPAFKEEGVCEPRDPVLKGPEKWMSPGIDAAEKILGAAKFLEGLFILALLKKRLPGSI